MNKQPSPPPPPAKKCVLTDSERESQRFGIIIASPHIHPHLVGILCAPTVHHDRKFIIIGPLTFWVVGPLGEISCDMYNASRFLQKIPCHRIF